MTATLLCAAWLGCALTVTAQEWGYYGATQEGLRYSPLTEINRNTVGDLDVAWVYRTGELERLGAQRAGEQSFENTPVLVDGALIVCTPVGRIVALEPASGRERWVFDPNTYPLPADLRFPNCRGVSPWLDPDVAEDAPCRRRLLYGTWAFRVYAIDARTGRRCAGFGRNGEVVLDPGKTLLPGEFMHVTSPPAVIDGVAVFGSMILDNQRTDAPSGKVRGLDARTGALRWEFDPVPREATDPAAASWLQGSAAVTGHANVWAPMSVDAARGLLFLPTTSPSPDFYGGRRPGENRYANSVVALRGATGEVVWHYQITHHDVWDYDLPAQPILVDLTHGGARVPALVQLTKQGLVFVLNRETGEPLFPVEERPVPQAGADGEWLSPTQPFPTAPPPLVDPRLGPEDAWGFTFIDRWFCRKRIEALRYEGMYTPPGTRGTILMPPFAGGANWGGGAVDPQRKLLLVSTMHVAGVVRLVPRAQESTGAPKYTDVNAGGIIRWPQLGTPYEAENWLVMSPLGAPCTPPPWGRLSAVDLERGTIAWQVPLGTLEKLLPLPLPLELGTPNSGGAIVTAGGLVFIAATMDDKFRAFDIDSGAVLWQRELPAGGQATPMTYAAAGRQYVVIAAGGHSIYQTTPGDYVVAFALKAGRD
ncbi:MAG: pyrroloquinoline quinone-dependent dehydrogenase [Gammaproteobacteria bacterium]|nr:pyrroloquinoline quinone-dependent dehydrogenase [Gammaproteobacteria bacterium]